MFAPSTLEPLLQYLRSPISGSFTWGHKVLTGTEMKFY